MSLKYLKNLKKSMDVAELSPELSNNLLDEMRFFFETLRIKLESQDPAMLQSAAEEVRELRLFLDAHPLLHSKRPSLVS